MYASIGTDIPGEGWTFEPKYDGVRVLAVVTPTDVGLITRNGKDKAAQFPEIADAFESIAKKKKRSFVLDGEIVALIDGEPARFRELQSRMHVQGKTDIANQATSTPSALIAFDLLVDGDTVMIDQPWTVRRKRLERFVGTRPPKGVRLGDSAPGDGEKPSPGARRDDWEGIIAKRVDSTYQPGNARATGSSSRSSSGRSSSSAATPPQNARAPRCPASRLLRRRRPGVRAIPAAASPARASRRWQNGSSDSSESHLILRPRCARTRRHTGWWPKSWSR
jgi:hypothetical protein